MNSHHWLAAGDIRFVRLVTVLGSLLLSLLAVLLNELPNTDAYTYARTADIALSQGIGAAFEHYQWAHFPLLLAGIHSLTGLSMFAAANIVNALLFALLSVSFVNIVAAMTPSRRTIWLAVACVLLYPHLNEFRAYIIRDIGYLAFCLLAVYYLIVYAESLRLRFGLYFMLSCLAASLFRPEALLFLFVTPVAVLVPTQSLVNLRQRAFLRLQTLSVLTVLTLGVALALVALDVPAQLRVFLQIYQPFLSNLAPLLGAEAPALEQVVFGDYAAQFVGDYTGIFLATGLIAVLLACIIDSLGLAVAPLLLYGAMRRFMRLSQPGLAVVLIWMLMAAGILLMFMLITRFVTTRYTLLLCTLLLVFVPFVLDRGWSFAISQQRKGFLRWATLLLVFAAIDAHLSFGASKQHLEDASRWINASTRATAPLLTNEIHIAYQSRRIGNYDEVRREISGDLILSAAPGTIIAVTPRSSFQAHLDAGLNDGRLRLLQQFPADRGSGLLVFEKEL
ncbi:MAG: hypothetical protein Q7W55_13160 [Pseudohongiella sp.]|nr:hypothetical protein [Pseudohongiella sp.]MDO9518826.1 hypothetical protein [Pseudohongiella sp.]MDP2128802.1 hypothetical protein [Pseudohongiella sp.]